MIESRLMKQIGEEGKKKTQETIKLFIETICPKLLKEKKGIYIAPLVKYSPEVIKEIEKYFELDFKSEITEGEQVFMFVRSKK